MIGDLFVVFLSFFIAFHISVYGKLNFERDLKLILTFGAFIIFFFYMYDLYDDKAKLEGTTTAVAISVLAGFVCTYIINVVLKWYYGSNRMWSYLFVFALVLSVAWRFLYSLLSARFKNKEKTLIIEPADAKANLAEKIKYAQNNANYTWYHIVDGCSEDETDTLINRILPQYNIVFLSPDLDPKTADKISVQALLHGKKLNVLADVNSVTGMNSSIRLYTDTPVIEINAITMSKLEMFIKRVFDIILSFFGLLILSPLFLISAVMVKLDTPGPVIYKQERYTKGKKRFNIYKFRTMVNDAEKYGAVFAGKNDPRITKTGNILRMLRLDELPQLINILRGDMSIVGPRPEIPVFADEFEKTVKDYQLRYLVKAGLTGYAQVYGKYNTAVEDKTLMDLIYQTNRSLLLDLKIIILTVKTMFTKSKTEGVDYTENNIGQIQREDSEAESGAKQDGKKSVGNYSDIQ